MARPLAIAILGLVLALADTIFAQQSQDDESQRLSAERFLTVLLKNPRRGTAFDKVYDYHLERASLDDFLKSLQAKAEGPDARQSAAMFLIAGMVHAQQGRNQEAIQAFSRAESLDPASVTAPYYLGQSLAIEGSAEKAAEAIERALQRMPAATELLDILQTLGRLHLRAQRNDKALDVWRRMERQFPGNAQVQEQIAIILLEENHFDEALPRYENLARVTQDIFRKSQFQVEAAEIKVRLGRTSDGLQDLEHILLQLNPDHWLFRDVRRRIESIYVKSNNQRGLVAYYEKWLKKYPEDLDAVSRLSRLLATLGRGRDAQRWLQDSLKLAPSSKELRLSLIGLLLAEFEYSAASAQFRELARFEPANPDVLREWGRVILRDTSVELADRQREATAIWKRMLMNKPKDAQIAAQVAELFRQAGLPDEAIPLYERAIELAPDAGQYREYLGEYFFVLKRTDDALATWREMATGPRKTAPNLARLAEVLAQYQQFEEAIVVNIQACELDPKDLNLQLKHVDLLSHADRHQDALQYLRKVKPLAQGDDEREACLRRELTELKLLDQLKEQIVATQTQLVGLSVDSPDYAERWHWLARACDEAALPNDAARAISRALDVTPNSIPYLLTAARINESQQKLRVAVELYTRLTSLDRRFRTEYLKRIANLQEALGHRDEAMQAGRDLLASAPGNPELSDHVAQLCFRLGRQDEGLQTLRRALRTNPGNLLILMKLAAALSKQDHYQDAIDLLWQAFARSTNLQERLMIVEQLAQHHQRIKALNVLYIRLERERRDPTLHRDLTLCLSRAYETVDDLDSAQRKLESLLTEDTRDSELLVQLRSLSERRKDMAGALSYQRKIYEFHGTRENFSQLLRLLLRNGKSDEAMELIATQSGASLSADALLLLDTLYRQGRRHDLEQHLARLRARLPDNWELLYREAVAIAPINRAQAEQRFEELLALKVPVDDPSLLASVPQGSLPPPTPPISSLVSLPLVERVNSFAAYEQIIGPQVSKMVDDRQLVTHSTSICMPADYGSARHAAWCWLTKFSINTPEGHRRILNTRFNEEPARPDRQYYIDRISVCSALGDVPRKFETARKLMHLAGGDIEASILYLKFLGDRSNTEPSVVQQFAVRQPRGGVTDVRKTVVPLTDDQLADALEAYGRIAGRTDLASIKIDLLQTVMYELATSKQEDKAALLLAEASENASTPIEIASLLIGNGQRPNAKTTCLLLDRLIAVGHLPPAPGAGATQKLQYIDMANLSGTLFGIIRDSTNSVENLGILKRYILIRSSKPFRNLMRVAVPTVSFRSVNQIPLRQSTFENGDDEKPALVLDHNAVAMVEMIRRQFEEGKPGEALYAAINQEITSAGNANERLYWQHVLAAILINGSAKESALEELADAARAFPGRKDLQYGLAYQYLLGGLPSKAFDLLEGVDGNTADEQREFDLLRLTLAAVANQKDRALPVVKRLATQKLTPDHFSEIAPSLIGLGLMEEVESLITGNTDTALLGIAELTLLMEIQLELGKKPQASLNATRVLEHLKNSRVSGEKKFATYLLRKTRDDHLQLTGSVIDAQEIEWRCYKILQMTGRLNEIIAKAEEDLGPSPGAAKLDSLIRLQTIAGNKDRVDELTIQKLTLNVNAPINRLALANIYLARGSFEAAVEHLRELFKQDPVFFASKCREILNPLSDKPESIACYIGLLKELDWCAGEKTLNAFPTILMQLNNRPSTTELADQLFQHVWENQPGYRADLAQRFSDDRWWQPAIIRDGLISVLEPPPASKMDEQWRIFGKLQRYQNKTAILTVWNRLLNDCQTQQTLDSLARRVEEKLKQRPDWTGGVVALAMIDLRRNHIEAGRDQLAALLPALEPILANQPMMAWEIAQELSQSPVSLEIGIRYFELAIRQSQRTDWLSGTTPGAALISVCIQYDRGDVARRILLQAVPDSLRRTADQSQAPAIRELAEILTIGRQLRNVGFPGDAIDLYAWSLERSKSIRVGGYDPRVEIQSSFNQALSEMTPALLARRLAFCVEKQSAPDLRVYVTRDGLVIPRQKLVGVWDHAIAQIAKDKELSLQTRETLDLAGKRFPQSPAPLVYSAQLAFELGDSEEAASFVKALVQRIKDIPLAEPAIPAADGAAAKSSAEADLDQIALWLVARRCLTDPRLESPGEVLGQRALAASKLDRSGYYQNVILSEWLLIAKSAQNQAWIERLKQELKTIQTVTPE